MDTDNSVVIARGKGKWGLRGGGQKEGEGISEIMSKIKKKENLFKLEINSQALQLEIFKDGPMEEIWGPHTK